MRTRQNSDTWSKDEPEQPRAWDVESGAVRKERAESSPRLSAELRILAPDVPDSLDSKLQMLGFARECAVAMLERYVIVVWRTELNVTGVHWARKAFINLRRSKPDGQLGLLMLADSDCDVSTGSAVRSELASLLTAYGARIAGFAVVYEGGGLRLPMLRGIVTSVSLASHARVVTEVFSNVANAATWLHARTRVPNDPVQPAHLLQAANRLRLK